MAKTRRIICCDGTWNTADAKYPTNVRRLVDLIAATDDHGIKQVVYYDEGVGTDKGFLSDIGNKIKGAFGWGLDDKIKSSYKKLCQNFNHDDEIYLIGFSRGAYTARSLGGLIRKCGLSDDCSDDTYARAIEIYRKQDTTPDTEEALRFRSEKSSRYVVTGKDIEWRMQNVPGFSVERVKPLNIKFLGVMDTVGALGIPEGGILGFLKFWNRKYRFHNTNASSMYENICHIVSLDETRTTFAPTLFSNLDDLNREHGRRSDDPEAPFKEVWAPGNHGSVGGGGDIVGLSHGALLYMCGRMEKLGVAFNQAALAPIRAGVDPLAALDCDSKGTIGPLGRVFLNQQDREGPANLYEVAPSTFERWKKDTDYRTRPPLARVADQIKRYLG